MTRYFFDVYDAYSFRDEVGRDFCNHQTLRNEALKAITGLTATESENGDGCTIVLQVRDEQGGIALTIRTVCQVDDSVMPEPSPRHERTGTERVPCA